jgi:hypothetical protein
MKNTLNGFLIIMYLFGAQLCAQQVSNQNIYGLFHEEIIRKAMDQSPDLSNNFFVESNTNILIGYLLGT